MRTYKRHIFRSGALLVAVMLLAGVFAGAASASPGRSPALAPAAALPATPCTGGTTKTCELWATTGAISVPGPTGPVSVPIWGYSTSSAAGTATLPGPALIVSQGDTVNVIVHNNLPAAAGNTSMAFPGQSLLPDTAGVAVGGSATYTFAASAEGTYLYEAGLTANGQVQAAMGLVGALVVQSSAASTAYGNSFTDQALLVLSEIDPALNNNLPDPTAFNMRNYAPKYWLINGEAYPHTDMPSPMITAAPGANLLFRYVNAGLLNHSMSLAGIHQTILAADGKPYTYSYRVTAETIPAGATLDTLATIPATAPAGTKFALYEAANHLDNNGTLTTTPSSPLSLRQIVFGGMLTFVTVAGTAAPAGPVTNNVALSPNPTNGTVSVSLTASIGTAGDPAIDQAEYVIDATGASGTGTAMAGTGAAPASVSATISTATLAVLPSGNHTFYVHGHNANGWGGFGSAVLNLDKLGPATSLLGLNPNPTNGAVDVALSATGSDVGRGNSNVDLAEYFIAPAGACPAVGGGGGTSMTISTPPAPATQVQFVATIAAATVSALAEGDHAVSVHTHDALGNWGRCATITLHVDKTAPNTSGALATPNPTNGTIGVLVGDFLQEKLTATVSDPNVGGINSNIKAAEGFIDTVTANGTGIVFLANDALFNSTTEGVYAAIPLFDMQAITQGRHTISIHGQDAAGNWGTMSTTTLDVDRTGPNVTSASATPNPTNGATSVTLNASATDPVTGGTPAPAPASNIVAAEWFDGADPGQGSGNAMTGSFGSTTVSNLSATINVSSFSLGTHNIKVRAKDVAGNWGPTTVVLLNVLPSDTIFADGFEAGNLSAWNGGVTGTGLSATGAGAMVGTQAMQVLITSNASRYVQDNSPVTTATGYRARFYFNPNGATTATGQQHDIFVALNSGNLTVFRIQYRRSSSSGNAAQVRAVVTRSGGTTTGAWFTINTNSANVIEVAWLAGSSTTFTLYTNGTAHPLTGLNTNSTSLRIDAVRLGPQVGPAPVTGTTPTGTTLAGVSGTEYFDAFVSRRNNTLIGP